MARGLTSYKGGNNSPGLSLAAEIETVAQVFKSDAEVRPAAEVETVAMGLTQLPRDTSCRGGNSSQGLTQLLKLKESQSKFKPNPPLTNTTNHVHIHSAQLKTKSTSN